MAEYFNMSIISQLYHARRFQDEWNLDRNLIHRLLYK